MTKPGFVELIDSRLPRHDIIRTAEVAAAFDVSRTQVLSWCESGRLEAVRYSAPDAPAIYRATRAAVMELARKMEAGE